MRLLRILRLIKLGRILKASRSLNRLADRFEKYIAIRHSTRAVIFWTTVILLLTHWYCCTWGLVHQLWTPQRTDALEAARINGTCEGGLGQCLAPCEMRLLASIQNNGVEREVDVAAIQGRESWLCSAHLAGFVPEDTDASHVEVYLYLLSTFGLPPTNRTVEFLVAFVIGLLTSVSNTLFLASVAAAFAQSDPTGQEFKQRMDLLNHFLVPDLSWNPISPSSLYLVMSFEHVP